MAVITALQVVRKMNEIMRSSPDQCSKQHCYWTELVCTRLKLLFFTRHLLCVGFYLSIMCLTVNEMDKAPHLSDLMLEQNAQIINKQTHKQLQMVLNDVRKIGTGEGRDGE